MSKSSARRRSTYTRAVRMVCEEKSIPYDLKQSPPHSTGRRRDSSVRQGPGDAPRRFRTVRVESDRHLSRSQLSRTETDTDRSAHAALTEQWVSLVNTRIDGTLVRTYLLNYIFPKSSDGSPDRKTIDAVVPAVKEEIELLDRTVAQRRLPRRRQLHLRRHQCDADPGVPEEFSRIRSAIAGGKVAVGLFRPPCRAAELSEHGAAAAAAGQGVVSDCISPRGDSTRR